MLQLNCPCGESLEIPESLLGDPTPCPNCNKPLRAIAGSELTMGTRVTGRLSIIKAEQRVGEQFFLMGNGPIEIGKLPDKPIALTGTRVSRNHCRLIPSESGWKVEDLKSTNGVFVNHQRIQSSELCDGDLLQVGEYEMRFSRNLDASPNPVPPTVQLPPPEPENPFDGDFGSYDLAPSAPLPSAPLRAAAMSRLPMETAIEQGPGATCPCCEKVLVPNAKICIACGIKVPSGRPIITSRGLDEDALVERTRAWLMLLSLGMRIGLLPVASEGFGTKKARCVWIILAITFVTSTLFLIANWGENRSLEYGNLMLWSGSNEKTIKRYEIERQSMEKLIAKEEKALKQGRPSQFTLAEIHEMKSLARELVTPKPSGEFHAYQLITAAFLHQGIMHFAGNMVFLLVFGLRVNELVGDLKFWIIYPLLAIASGLAYMASTAGQPLHPLLGASGAIMGLAGMYFVFFPVQRVHMVAWIRIGWTWGFFLKMFRMHGFWLLVMWTGFNDLLPMALSSQGDHVAHWAHLGGFLSGMALATALLISRQASARGGDLWSVVLGRYAWPLLGKPNQNLEAPIAPPPRPPRNPRGLVYSG